MKNFLKTFTVTIPANESASTLSATGTALTVYETTAPFIVRDESGSLFDIDRACRVESEGEPFGRLTLLRPDGVTGEIRVKLAVGNGIRFVDGRLQYTSTTVNAPALKIDTISARVPVAQTRARFMPKYSAKLNLAGVARFVADDTAAPVIKAGLGASLNLLAPANPDVSKRVVRLLSGAACKLGFGGGLAGPSVPGHFVALDSSTRPEVEIPGGETLVGLADADATVSVLEVLQTATGTVTAPASFDASLTPAELSGLTPTLAGSISYTFSAGTALASFDGEGYIKWNGSAKATNWPTIYTGSVGYQTSGGPTTGSAANPNGTNTITFSGMLSADAGIAPDGDFAGSLVANCAYIGFRISATTAGKTIIFSNGQSFTLPTSAANHSKYIRIRFPYDETAPVVEQKTEAQTWVTAS